MDLHSVGESELRFRAYIGELGGAVGHPARRRPLQDYCIGLMGPSERKSVEPIAAVTAPDRTSAQHQSLLHFVGESDWSDEEVLAKVRQMVLPPPCTPIRRTAAARSPSSRASTATSAARSPAATPRSTRSPPPCATVGWAKSHWTIHPRGQPRAEAILPTRPRVARLPTLIWGLLSQAAVKFGLVAEARRARRRAEPCVAQRDDRAPGEDWLPTIAATHCITSYPVGSS